jgi:hypothetical protein
MQDIGSQEAATPCMDAYGRPVDLEDRLTVIGAVLAASGLSQAVSTMNLFAFWEEAMSPVLGCSVKTVGFARTPAGPRSLAVGLVLDAWRREGLLERNADYDADLEEAENMTGSLLDRAAPFRSGHADIRPVNLTPMQSRTWWNMLDYFLQGLMEREIGTPPTRTTPNPGIGHSDSEGDLRRCMLCDPAYILPGWEEVGPAAAEDDLTKLGIGTQPGTWGNPMASMMQWWMQRGAQDRPGIHCWQLPFWHGAYLSRTAARRFEQEHGDWRYYEALDLLTVRRTDMDDGKVEEAFWLRDGSACIGSILWRPVGGQEAWKLQRGFADADLLDIDIAVDHRSDAFGCVVLRHASTRNCRKAPPPLPGAEGIWGRHGCRQGDGTYRLVRTHYSLVKPEDPTAVDAPQKGAQAAAVI